MEYTDSEILQQFRQQDTRSYAFNLLMRKYQQRIYWHIRKIVINHDDADDVVQNTFLKVWGGLQNFREDSQLFTWLYRIATNEALTFIQQRAKKQGISSEEIQQKVINNLESDVWFDGNEIQISRPPMHISVHLKD